MKLVGLVGAIFLLVSGPAALAAEPEEGPVLQFGAPESFDRSHYPAMDAYFEPIQRFFNALHALNANWRYVEPRQYAIDLNGDGQEEYILDSRVRQLNLYNCPVVCYKLLTIVEIERDANGVIIGPRYLGTVATSRQGAYEPGFDQHILSIGEPGQNGWRSLSNGPPVRRSLTDGSASEMVGGHRFCWTDKPEPIDFSQFHWIDERGGLADLLTIGLPYRDGGPGYFKIVGHDEECPE